MDDLDELARAQQAAPYRYYSPRPPPLPGGGWGLFHTIIAGLLVALLALGAVTILLRERPAGDAIRPRGGGDGGELVVEPPDISVTADDLQAAYLDNEIAADASYQGRNVAVSGRVDSVGRDILNHPYVVVHARRGLGVQCFFPESRVSSISSLHRGDGVLIRGRCTGKALTLVIVKDCSI